MKVKAGGEKKTTPQQPFTEILPKFMPLDKAGFLLLADVLCSWLAETRSSGRPQPTCRNTQYG